MSRLNINGYGFMVFSTLNLEKHISGFVAQVNTELLSRVLADLAREFDLNQSKRILLVLDQAGWHTTDQLALPEGIDLFFVPSHSPELQPAERLWPLTNEALAEQVRQLYRQLFTRKLR
nr:transposase [Okeania sp. SIO2F4]